MKEKKLEQQKVIAETLNGRLAMLGSSCSSNI